MQKQKTTVRGVWEAAAGVLWGTQMLSLAICIFQKNQMLGVFLLFFS